MEGRLVAPRAGAWIETTIASIHSRFGIMSHPVRVRGLKPGILSPPGQFKRVAPRAGAWIETRGPSCNSGRGRVAPRAGAWIETENQSQRNTGAECRTPCGCVD